VDGIRHAAYLGLPDDRLGQRAVLCVERAQGGMNASIERSLREALAEIPVDEIRSLSIPRDPRHASKSDLDRLRALLGTGPRGRPETTA